MAGALAQQNAEALGVIALSQIVNPGAPMVYGGFTSNADMRSGSPAFGTPEYTKAALASGQLARRYSLPFRSSIPMHPIVSTRRPPGNRRCRYGEQLWGLQMYSNMRLAGSKAVFVLPSRNLSSMSICCR